MAFAAGAATAAPVQWTGPGGNGHWYDFISGSFSWTAANAAAEAATFMGLDGYLATITSGAENSWIVNNVQGDGWIGATDQSAEGDWKWVGGPEAGTTFWLNGSTLTYASWNGGEPNDCCGGSIHQEDYAQLQRGAWNDLPNGSGRGYFIEYSAIPDGGGAIPEPGTWALMILGFAGAGALLRRQRMALA